MPLAPVDLARSLRFCRQTYCRTRRREAEHLRRGSATAWDGLRRVRLIRYRSRHRARNDANSSFWCILRRCAAIPGAHLAIFRIHGGRSWRRKRRRPRRPRRRRPPRKRSRFSRDTSSARLGQAHAISRWTSERLVVTRFENRGGHECNWPCIAVALQTPAQVGSRPRRTAPTEGRALATVTPAEAGRSCLRAPIQQRPGARCIVPTQTCFPRCRSNGTSVRSARRRRRQGRHNLSRRISSRSNLPLR